LIQDCLEAPLCKGLSTLVPKTAYFVSRKRQRCCQKRQLCIRKQDTLYPETGDFVAVFGIKIACFRVQSCLLREQVWTGLKMCVRSEVAGPVSFVCSFRFALSVLCFLVTANLCAQRIGMSVAIVCMVNHTAITVMRDADQTITSSSNNNNDGNFTVMTPGEWRMNDSDDATSNQLQSPCVGNLIIADSNSSAAVVGLIVITVCSNYTVSQKNVPTLKGYSLKLCGSILMIFGRNIHNTPGKSLYASAFV